MADSPGGAEQEAAKKQRLMSSPGITRGPPLPEDAERDIDSPADWRRFASMEGSIPLHDPALSQKPATEIFPEGLWWLEVKVHGHPWVLKAHEALKLAFGPAEAREDTPGSPGSPDKLSQAHVLFV